MKGSIIFWYVSTTILREYPATVTKLVPLGEVELFDGRNWKQSYGDIKEAVPHDLPTPKMKPVKIVIYFDASFACDMVTRQSITGIIVFVSSTPM